MTLVYYNREALKESKREVALVYFVEEARKVVALVVSGYWEALCKSYKQASNTKITSGCTNGYGDMFWTFDDMFKLLYKTIGFVITS